MVNSTFQTFYGFDDELYFTHLIVFFWPALAEAFPLELEWLQVSSNLLDFSQYSGRS